MSNCTSCGREVYDWEQSYYDSFQVCSDCYRRRFGSDGKNLICTKCTKRIGESEANRSLGTTLCKDCYKKEMQRRAEWMCALCKKNIKLDQKKFKTPDGKTLCEECAGKGSLGLKIEASSGNCSKCGSEMKVGLDIGKNRALCMKCAEAYTKEKTEKGESIGTKLKRLLGKE